MQQSNIIMMTLGKQSNKRNTTNQMNNGFKGTRLKRIGTNYLLQCKVERERDAYTQTKLSRQIGRPTQFFFIFLQRYHTRWVLADCTRSFMIVGQVVPMFINLTRSYLSTALIWHGGCQSVCRHGLRSWDLFSGTSWWRWTFG